MANEMATRPGNEMKKVLSNGGIKAMFTNVLAENANAFMASLIDVYSSDDYLAKCNPNDVAMVALKAATLKLPINKELGFSYIIAYKDNKSGKFVPQMQIGYKGYIQLAMRTGQYRNLNANVIYEGMTIEEDYLSREIKIAGKPTSNKVIGYFAFFKLLNGFEKINYMSTKDVTEHAKKFSKTYPNGAWKDNFDAMAMKTVTRLLISKYGPMSTEMQKAEMQDADAEMNETITLEANTVPVQIAGDDDVITVDPETGEILDYSVDEVNVPF